MNMFTKFIMELLLDKKQIYGKKKKKNNNKVMVWTKLLKLDI